MTEQKKGGGEAPRLARGTQIGERLEQSVTTNSPRGVGELPSDYVHGGEGGLADGQRRVKAMIDEENEKGYRGTVPDPTPNENYTVAGVTRGLPTPETVVYTPRGQ